MENHRLVLPMHLNHHGNLFGGYLLMWVDEFAFLAASQDYPKASFVTVAMDDSEFRHGVQEGAILKFQSKRSKVGTTSVSYDVEVSIDGLTIFTNCVTFVALDTDGVKTPLPKD